MYHNFGLVLPDLVGMHTRGWKPLYAFDKGDRHQVSMNKGIERHHKIDRFFHNSDYFTEKTSGIKKIYEPLVKHIPGIRLSFISHIILELMLDRIILKHESSCGEDFYSQMQKINLEKLTNLTFRNEEHMDSFLSFLNNFIERKYLLGYVENQNLCYALNRIFTRVKQPEINGIHSELFNNLIFETENYLSIDYEEWFNQMRKHQ